MDLIPGCLFDKLMVVQTDCACSMLHIFVASELFNATDCNHMIVTGYVLIGEIACNKYPVLLLLALRLAFPAVIPQHCCDARRPIARLRTRRSRAPPAGVKCMCTRRVKSGRCIKSMNPKNTKKSPIHENANANITCDFCDGDISHLGVA